MEPASADQEYVGSTHVFCRSVTSSQTSGPNLDRTTWSDPTIRGSAPAEALAKRACHQTEPAGRRDRNRCDADWRRSMDRQRRAREPQALL